MSHPLRVRGLKLNKAMFVEIKLASHPLRVRGLKHCNLSQLRRLPVVASFTGAWIETLNINKSSTGSSVASFTGAWIETHIMMFYGYIRVSHPLRVRGLKLLQEQKRHPRLVVASFTGAWIETDLFDMTSLTLKSRILYGCVD